MAKKRGEMGKINGEAGGGRGVEGDTKIAECLQDLCFFKKN